MSIEVPVKMKAAVVYGPKDMRVEEVDVPEINSREVLINVKYCGICGTDLHIRNGIYSSEYFPLIAGHEFTGEVVEVGNEVKNLKVGDRVTVDENIGCGVCYFCKHNQKLMCEKINQIGIHSNGAFAEYVKAPADLVFKLPENISHKDGTFIEPLTCIIHANERMNIQLGSSIAIIGAGPIGLIHLQIANLRGACPVIISEVNEHRLEVAQKLGADFVVDAKDKDLALEIRRITYNRGVDFVVEAAGNPLTYQQAMEIVRPGGEILAFGLCSAKDTFPLSPFKVTISELRISGSVAGSYATWLQAIALLSYHRFDPAPLISRVVSLDELPKTFEEIEKNQNLLKVLVAVSGD
ncbi:zinc-dependent alcohol dehydrogenase family protein [Candidatus Aerophobetes bacterium]|nr:zinc-dependent alcohol dehydrogenase family protein [Candidatus Aerophobetes bacterium]